MNEQYLRKRVLANPMRASDGSGGGNELFWDRVGGDPKRQYRPVEGGASLELSIGDFPVEAAYTLLVDGIPAGEFDSWPETWTRRDVDPGDEVAWTMRADVDGAVRTAILAAAFDWTWRRTDPVRLCEKAGWSVSEMGERGAALVTDLEIAAPEAEAYFDAVTLADLGVYDQELVEIVVFIAQSEGVSETERAATDECLSKSNQRCSPDLGRGLVDIPTANQMTKLVRDWCRDRIPASSVCSAS